MLIRTSRKSLWRLARKAGDFILPRPQGPKWIDDVTPPWVSDGILHPASDNSLRDVSGAFDDQPDP